MTAPAPRSQPGSASVPSIDAELPLEERLRARSRAVFLAAEASPARDMSNHFVEAADEITSLKSQVEGLRRAMEWQPIETAPKDGTPILYINRFKEVGHCQHMLWPEEDNYEAWWDYQRDDEVCPLYWMAALPDLPSALSLEDRP